MAINRLVIASLEEAWQSRVWFCKGIFGQEALDRRAPLAMTTASSLRASKRRGNPADQIASEADSEPNLIFSPEFLREGRALYDSLNLFGKD